MSINGVPYDRLKRTRSQPPLPDPLPTLSSLQDGAHGGPPKRLRPERTKTVPSLPPIPGTPFTDRDIGGLSNLPALLDAPVILDPFSRADQHMHTDSSPPMKVVDSDAPRARVRKQLDSSPFIGRRIIASSGTLTENINPRPVNALSSPFHSPRASTSRGTLHSNVPRRSSKKAIARHASANSHLLPPAKLRIPTKDSSLRRRPSGSHALQNAKPTRKLSWLAVPSARKRSFSSQLSANLKGKQKEDAGNPDAYTGNTSWEFPLGSFFTTPPLAASTPISKRPKRTVNSGDMDVDADVGGDRTIVAPRAPSIGDGILGFVDHTLPMVISTPTQSPTPVPRVPPAPKVSVARSKLLVDDSIISPFATPVHARAVAAEPHRVSGNDSIISSTTAGGEPIDAGPPKRLLAQKSAPHAPVQDHPQTHPHARTRSRSQSHSSTATDNPEAKADDSADELLDMFSMCGLDEDERWERMAAAEDSGIALAETFRVTGKKRRAWGDVRPGELESAAAEDGKGDGEGGSEGAGRKGRGKAAGGANKQKAARGRPRAKGAKNEGSAPTLTMALRPRGDRKPSGARTSAPARGTSAKAANAGKSSSSKETVSRSATSALKATVPALSSSFNPQAWRPMKMKIEEKALESTEDDEDDELLLTSEGVGRRRTQAGSYGRAGRARAGAEV